MHIHGVREPHDVVLARDDVGRRGNIAEHICGEVWQGEHHIIKLVVAEHIVDFYTYDEIRLHRLRTRVGAAGYYRARNIGVSCGERQRDNSAVAVTYNIRLFQLHGGDELRGVVRHGFVVYRAGVAALPMAAALDDIDRVFVGEIACRLCKRLCAAAVAP